MRETYGSGGHEAGHDRLGRDGRRAQPEEGAEGDELGGGAGCEVGEDVRAHDEGRVLAAGHCDVEAVPVEEEAHAANP